MEIVVQQRHEAPAKRLLQSVLLPYLMGITPRYLPGVDGQTVDQVLREYRQFATLGAVPNRERLIQQNPDLEPEIESFFTDQTRERV